MALLTALALGIGRPGSFRPGSSSRP